MPPKIVRRAACVALFAEFFAREVRAGADNTPSAASKPDHEVKIEFDRRIPLRDGATLSADVYHDRDHPSHLLLPIVPAKP